MLTSGMIWDLQGCCLNHQSKHPPKSIFWLLTFRLLFLLLQISNTQTDYTIRSARINLVGIHMSTTSDFRFNVEITKRERQHCQKIIFWLSALHLLFLLLQISNAPTDYTVRSARFNLVGSDIALTCVSRFNAEITKWVSSQHGQKTIFLLSLLHWQFLLLQMSDTQTD
jgi:hypothetical protein